MDFIERSDNAAGQAIDSCSQNSLYKSNVGNFGLPQHALRFLFPHLRPEANR